MTFSPNSSSEQQYPVAHQSSSIAFTRPIVIGTRGSALAQWQARFVEQALKRLHPELEIEVRIIKTSGDKDQVRPLAELGGLGVFTKEIENALLNREIDLAVHSLKDLPTETAEGLMLAAIPEREDARDCLVSRHGVGLEQLPPGARVGTSSARRGAQVLALRRDLQVVPLRGNVDTRLRKAQTQDYDAVVLAAAGITRLGRASEITQYLSFDAVLPDPGQGALAIEIRADDSALARLLAGLDHAPTRAAVTAERAFLRALGGGCRMPIGAYAEIRNAQLVLQGMVGALDGSRRVCGEISGAPARAEPLGAELAGRLLREGAAEILRAQAVIKLPLAGRRILITRAREQAGELADKLRALGGEPVQFPTIQVAPVENFAELDEALERAAEFDWVVFTSANGVRAVAERLNELGRSPRLFDSPRLAAIGPATAHALEELGLRVSFIPTRFLGEQVARELPVQPGEKALLLRADIASDVLARVLAERGVSVTNVVAYRTIKASSVPAHLEQIDAVTFTSPSTVRNFVEMLDDKTGLGGARVFCIGPVTAQAAAELGLPVDAVAREHTMDGLVQALAEFYAAKA